jgi:hypothetical protein
MMSLRVQSLATCSVDEYRRFIIIVIQDTSPLDLFVHENESTHKYSFLSAWRINLTRINAAENTHKEMEIE